MGLVPVQIGLRDAVRAFPGRLGLRHEAASLLVLLSIQAEGARFDAHARRAEDEAEHRRLKIPGPGVYRRGSPKGCGR